jgi:hypothetical protein
MMTALAWLESTSVARTISGSLPLTASVSAVHFLGYTLVLGGALLNHLRLVGAVLQRAAVRDVVRPAGYVIALGLGISIATGALLFAGRATSIAANGIFQTKVSLLLIAAVWQLGVHYRLARSTSQSKQSASAVGFVGLALWLGLAVTACAFVLLE